MGSESRGHERRLAVHRPEHQSRSGRKTAGERGEKLHNRSLPGDQSEPDGPQERSCLEPGPETRRSISPQWLLQAYIPAGDLSHPEPRVQNCSRDWRWSRRTAILRIPIRSTSSLPLALLILCSFHKESFVPSDSSFHRLSVFDLHASR